MVTVSSPNTTMVKKIIGNLDNSRYGQSPSPYAECLKGPTGSRAPNEGQCMLNMLAMLQVAKAFAADQESAEAKGK